MENVINTVEEKVIVRASDLQSALKEVSDGTNTVRIVVLDDEFFTYFSDERGGYRISDIKKAAHYGISDVTLIATPDVVERLLAIADEQIKAHGEQRALIVFYIRRISENESRYRIDTLNSTLEDEIEAVNRMYRELILNL